jgi:hypothetical protein
LSKEVPDSDLPNAVSKIELIVRGPMFTKFLIKTNSNFKNLFQRYLSEHNLVEGEIKLYLGDVEIDLNKTPMDV